MGTKQINQIKSVIPNTSINKTTTNVMQNNKMYKSIFYKDIIKLFIKYNIPVAKETINVLKQRNIYYV